jgi:hypothetical protein
MGPRPSKIALREAAELLGVTTSETREYLRGVQHVAGFPVPYATIVEAMRETGSAAPDVVASRAAEIAARHSIARR